VGVCSSCASSLNPAPQPSPPNSPPCPPIHPPQVVHVCAEHKKPAKLTKHLSSIRAASAGARNPPRILVFANRVKTVKFLLGAVRKEGWRAEALHGQRSQGEREAAIAGFRWVGGWGSGFGMGGVDGWVGWVRYAVIIEPTL